MRELDKILEKRERVMWEGQPQFWPFFLGSVLVSIFGLFWLGFVLIFTFFIGVYILLLPHFWVGIFLVFGPPIYSWLVYSRMYYAITDRRVIIQKGLVGRDFEIADFDKITNAEVDVGLWDKLAGKDSGSIMIATAGTFTYSRQGTSPTPYTLKSITHPYEVFKFFKKVSFDVKTDVEYPNKYRPRTNPGFRTKYKPRK